MKKINYLFLLFFAYFVCVLNVYASCSFIQNSDNHTTTTYNCDYVHVEAIRNYSRSLGVSSTTDHDYTDLLYLVDSDMELVTNYNLFGTYSNGSLIPYAKPKPSFTSFAALTYEYSASVGADAQGNAWWSKTFNSTKYTDIDFGSNLTSKSMNRLDFSIHINFNSIPEKVKKTIFGGLMVDPVMPSGASGQSYCTSHYDYYSERIDVSCAFNYDGSNAVVRILNNIPTDTIIDEGSSSYWYHCYFDVSAYTLVASNISFNDSNIDDLDTDESPGGSAFNDDYNVISSNASFFSNFESSDFEGLTAIVTSPLRFIRSLRATSSTALNFTIFGKQIILPTGYTLFWNKTISYFTHNNTAYLHLPFSNTTLQPIDNYNAYNNFRSLWRTIFGGFLIYITARKLLFTCMRAVSPDLDKVEVL